MLLERLELALVVLLFGTLCGALSAVGETGVRALSELGADMQALGFGGQSAAEAAKNEGHAACAAWLRRSRGWQALHRACDARRGPAAILPLLHAGADPARPSPAGETPAQICRLDDPKAGALPADAATTAIVEQAALPWHMENHRLFPDAFRPIVVTLLLVQQRLQRDVQQPDESSSDDEEDAVEQGQAGGGQRQRREGRLAVFVELDIWVLWIVPKLPRFGWGM